MAGVFKQTPPTSVQPLSTGLGPRLENPSCPSMHLCITEYGKVDRALIQVNRTHNPGWQGHLWSNLFCVEWDTKTSLSQHNIHQLSPTWNKTFWRDSSQLQSLGWYWKPNTMQPTNTSPKDSGLTRETHKIMCLNCIRNMQTTKPKPNGTALVAPNNIQSTVWRQHLRRVLISANWAPSGGS